MSKSFNSDYILIKVQRPKCLLQSQCVKDLFAASVFSTENCVINKYKSIICLPMQRREIWFHREALCHLIVNMNTSNKQVPRRYCPALLNFCLSCLCINKLTMIILSYRYMEALPSILTAKTPCYFAKVNTNKITYFYVIFTASFSSARPGSLL